MWVPSKRLLWLVALGILPAWLLPSFAGLSLETVCLAGLSFALVALLDAMLSLKHLSGITVAAPSLIRISKNKAFDLHLQLEGVPEGPRHLRVGIAFPKSLEVASPELTVFPAPESKGSAAAQWSVLPRVRGSIEVHSCFLEIRSLLGFWDMRGSRALSCEVRVYPDLTKDRQKLAPLFSRKAAGGLHQVRQLGKGREFQQLRTYVPGDNFGDIYWKATAKRGFPVTMLHQVERTQEIHVLIDISRRTARPLERAIESPSAGLLGPDTQCERFLQTALLLALATEQQGDRFGLLTFSDQVHTALPAGCGRAHFNACREAVYALEARMVNPDFHELFVHIGNHIRTRSLLIVLTDIGEPGLSEAFLEAVQMAAQKHVILVHVLGSRQIQPLFSSHAKIKEYGDLYRCLAGHLQWSDLQETLGTLKQGGVHLTASLQENLAARAVSEYLRIKKGQLL